MQMYLAQNTHIDKHNKLFTSHGISFTYKLQCKRFRLDGDFVSHLLSRCLLSRQFPPEADSDFDF